MAWFYLLLIQVGLQILSGLLTNKNAKPEKKLDLPHVDASTPVPVAFGRCLIKDPFLIDYFDFKSEKITIQNPATFFITKTTIGYKYFIGMVFGLCFGTTQQPTAKGTKLLEILIDNRSAWLPASSPPVTNGQGLYNGADDPVIINKPTLFGEEKKEGGVRVEGYWYTGMDIVLPSASDQLPNAYWATQRGVTMPNYKDVCYFVWHGPSFGNLSPSFGGKKSGMIGNAPRLWPIAFKVARFPRLLTHGIVANEVSDVPFGDSPPIDSYVHANPIEALYECLISTLFGAGIAEAHLYTGTAGGQPDTFTSAAVECHLEGMAFSYVWSSASPVEEMLAEILRYVDAALWTDPASGLIKLTLARADYSLGSLPSLSNDDFIEIQSFTRGSWRDTKSEVRVSFPDQSKVDYEMNTAAWRNPANYQIQGASDPAEITFRGCPSFLLANRLAAREGRVVSTPLARLKGTIDRKAWQLHPVSVFKFSWPEQGITDMVMRITTMTLGTLLEGTITISAVEDVFAVGSATYAPTTSTVWTDPLGGEADDVPEGDVGELPYWFQRDDVPRVFGVAERPDATHIDYTGLLNANEDDAALSTDFTPTGTLAANLDQLSGTDYNTAGFDVENIATDADLIEAGTSTTIATQGAGLALIGDPGAEHEWIAFESVTDNLDGSVTLDNIWRGLLDTPPRTWTLGDRVWFFNVGSALFGTPLTDGQAIIFEALTRTMRDQLRTDEATNFAHTVDSRALKPLPPHYVRLGGSYTTLQQDTGDLVFTWREHSRLTALELFKQSAATDAAEAGVTWEIDIYATDGSLLRAVTGISALTYTYTNADELSDNGTASLETRLRLEFFASRDGIRSLLPWVRYVYRIDPATYGAMSATVASTSAVTASMIESVAMAATVASTSEVTADLTNTAGIDPDLVLWLAAWKETGLTNGDRLATITDFSGNGNHFTQTTGANKPEYQTGVLNSQPGFWFDGAAYYAEIAAFLSGNAEVFMVLKCFNDGSSDTWGAYKFDGGTLASHITFLGTLYTALGGTNRNNYVPGAGVVTAGFVHQVVVQAGANNWLIYENGNNLEGTATQTIDWGSGVSPRHMIGASSTSADGSGQSNYFKGHILEIQIYNSVRTTGERNTILADFNSRYGITVTNF